MIGKKALVVMAIPSGCPDCGGGMLFTRMNTGAATMVGDDIYALFSCVDINCGFELYATESESNIFIDENKLELI
jgi:hypothetical protein